MRPLPLLLSITAVVAIEAREARDAEACSPPLCWTAFFTPAEGATVPANIPALHWAPMRTFDSSGGDPSKVTLRAVGGTPIALTATMEQNGNYVLVPAETLVPGETYELRDANTCQSAGTEGPTVRFQAGPMAPLPAALGTLSAMASDVGRLEVGTASGSCSSEVQADQATIDLALASDAAPWKDALHYETFVDGLRWSASSSINVAVAPGTSWRGRAADRVYRVCESMDPNVGDGLGAGPHEVVMRATLPGTSLVLASATVTVELTCAAEPPDECDPAIEDCTADDGAGGGGGCTTTDVRGSWMLLVLAALFVRRRFVTR